MYNVYLSYITWRLVIVTSVSPGILIPWKTKQIELIFSSTLTLIFMYGTISYKKITLFY